MTCPCWRWQLSVPEQCWICIMFFFAGRMPFTIIPLMSFRVSGSNTIFILCVPWPMVNQRSRKRHREESADVDAELAEGVICKSVGRLPPNAPWSWLCFLVSICVWNIYIYIYINAWEHHQNKTDMPFFHKWSYTCFRIYTYSIYIHIEYMLWECVIILSVCELNRQQVSLA